MEHLLDFKGVALTKAYSLSKMCSPLKVVLKLKSCYMEMLRGTIHSKGRGASRLCGRG
jgi:hypothetical protein